MIPCINKSLFIFVCAGVYRRPEKHYYKMHKNYIETKCQSKLIIILKVPVSVDELNICYM